MEKKSLIFGMGITTLAFLLMGFVMAYAVSLSGTNDAWVTTVATARMATSEKVVNDYCNMAVANESKKAESQQLLKCVYEINKQDVRVIVSAYDRIKDQCSPTTTIPSCKEGQQYCVIKDGYTCCTSPEVCNMGVGCVKGIG